MKSSILSLLMLLCTGLHAANGFAEPLDVGAGGRLLPLKPLAAPADPNQTVPRDLYVEPATLRSLGFEWEIAGDDNRNGRVAVGYRKIGEEAWRTGMDLLRIQGERINSRRTKPDEPPNWEYVCGNLYAGSILFLEPGTRYEVRLSLTDPDGVGGQAEWHLIAATKSEPQMFTGGRRLHVYPTDFKGAREQPAFDDFQAAYDAVQPGDQILLHRGRYGGAYVLEKKGTREKPIVIRSAGDGPVEFRGDPESKAGVTRVAIKGTDQFHYHENRTLFEVSRADYHWFEGLVMGNYDYAIHSTGEGTTVGLTVRHCRFWDCGWSAILMRSSACRDTYIADNVFLGTQGTWHRDEQRQWPYKGVWVNGQGVDVCYNRAQNHKDGISVFAEGASRDVPEKKVSAIDFYNNDVGQSWDDNEADGGQHNIRFFLNRFVDEHVGLSAQPVYGGPCYFIRNVQYNVTRGVVFKTNLQPAGVLAFHNTSITTGTIGHRAVAAITAGYSNSQFLNNLFLGIKGTTLDTGFFDPGISHLDYNGYTLVEPIRWITFDERLRGRLKAYATFAELAAATGNEEHAVMITFDDFVNLPKPPGESKTHTDLNFGDARLKPDSKAVDAGRVIPNVNDGFAGKGPDLGTYETARAFAYGGHAGRAMYDPAVPPEPHESFAAYKKNAGPTINHFYEKLLLLKDRMNTTAGRALAAERHAFMKEFLRRFFDEWGAP